MQIDEIKNILNIYKLEKVAGLYNIGKTIGKGHFAVVKEARHVLTEEKVAIKIIDKTKLDQVSKDQLLSEVMCMKLVQHPNIIRLYEVVDTVNKLYLILELGDGGDLYDYIINNGYNGLCEDEAKRYFRQILRAIGYCHKLHVVHRDIKPENVVFFKQLELVKLTDFGFSNKFVPGDTLSTSCGSLAYSAPEILLGDSYDAPKVDIWSLGVILFMLVVGSLPFNETNDSETIAKIMDCKFTIPSFVSNLCQTLIKKMLIRDASKRATLDEIINDVWLKIDINDREYELETYNIPLLNQEQLTFEEHIEILTKMSGEHLASIDEIQQVLDNNEYSHISATYYLLAERKLKRRFVEEYVELKSRHNSCNKDIHLTLEKQKSNISNQTSFDATRRISMILEGEENEENEAITSLAFVRRELDNFIPENEQCINNIPGTTKNSSRCVSRINSVIDLPSLSDENDSDSNSTAIRPRLRIRSSTYRNNSPGCNRHSTGLSISSDYNFDKDKKRKYFTQYPIMMNKITNIKKSFSVTDLSERKKVNVSLDNAKIAVHKFSIGSNTSRFSNNSAKYMDIRKLALNDQRSIQVFFDTSSASTTANCSSADNSDIENDIKVKVKKTKSIVTKQISLLTNNTSNLPSLLAKTYSADCYRSQSFDGRLRNNVQVDLASVREAILRKSKGKSPSSNSWHRNSLCNHLADSNFSLVSLASKLENPNMMQVIRGAIELHLQNRQSSIDPALSTITTTISPSNTVPTCSKKEIRRSRNIYKHICTTLPKFKKQKLYVLTSHSKSSNSLLKHSAINISNSCHSFSKEKTKKPLSTINSVTICSSVQHLSSSSHSDQKLNKNVDLFNKKQSLTCCTLS